MPSVFQEIEICFTEKNSMWFYKLTYFSVLKYVFIMSEYKLVLNLKDHVYYKVAFCRDIRA